MSADDYHVSLELMKNDTPFYALIMAAIRKADDKNLFLLSTVFPEIVAEFRARYNAPGGVIPSDHTEPRADLPSNSEGYFVECP